jgi:hypothetical protein
MRIGLCIEEGNLDAFRTAVQINATLWGGRFNPIISIGASTDAAKHIVSAFQVDALQDISTTKVVTDFIESLPHLKWPGYEKSLFVPRDGGADAILLDVYHPVRHLAQRPPTPSDKQFQAFLLQWKDDDPLRDVLTASYGAYPAKETIGKDYLTLFRRLKPTEVHLAATDPVPTDVADMLSPVALTTLELSPTRLSWGHEEPGFYVGSTSDLTDLINFWNLRAANIDLVFYDPAFETRLEPVVNDHKEWLQTRPKRNPEWPFHSSLWTKTRDPLPNFATFGEGFAISVIDEHLWDPNVVWKPPVMSFDEQSILGTVTQQFGQPTVTFQLPPKPCFTDFELHEQKLVAAIRPLIQTPDFILRPPHTPELNEYYGRQIHFDSSKVRSEPEALGVIIEVTLADLTLRPLDSLQLITRLFASRNIEAKQSEAGKVGHRLIQQMGGLQGCRVFKIPGVRELIHAHRAQDSFTRSCATQTIRGFDPATNVEAFALHKNLYVQYREAGELKPDAAFAYLLDKKMFSAGLTFTCPNCALPFWVHLDSLKTFMQCEYCDTSINVMPQLKDRDWKFRRSGLFGRDDHQGGGIPVAVVLQQLETVLHSKIFAWTTGLDLEQSEPNGWKCESDFVVITDGYRDGPQIIFSETKSRGGEITADDVANLTRVADAFEGSSLQPYIIFAKVGSFSDEEIERCKLAQVTRRFRVIMLSDRELEPYFVYERTAVEFDIDRTAVNLEDLAVATQSVFFNPRRRAVTAS